MAGGRVDEISYEGIEKELLSNRSSTESTFPILFIQGGVLGLRLTVLSK